MNGRSAAVLLLIVSFITKSISYDSYGDYKDQMRNYYDSLYQRSFTKEQPSRDAEPSILDLKMPGVHPETVGKHFLILLSFINYFKAFGIGVW